MEAGYEVPKGSKGGPEMCHVMTVCLISHRRLGRAPAPGDLDHVWGTRRGTSSGARPFVFRSRLRPFLAKWPQRIPDLTRLSFLVHKMGMTPARG